MITPLDWQAIDTVLLDMDGTLLDLRFDNHFWQEYIPHVYAEKEGVSILDSHRILHQWYLEHRGTLNWYCLDFWSKQLGIDVAEHKRALKEGIALRPSAQWFLQEARKQVKTLALVTNAHQATLSIKLEKTGIAPYFDAIVCSHDVGLPKENIAFWDEMQHELHFDPKRTLFIDDSIAVLDSAKAYGIAYVIGVLLPDSTANPIEHPDYPLVDRFFDLL